MPRCLILPLVVGSALYTGGAYAQQNSDLVPMNFEAHTTGGNSSYMRNQWIQATGSIGPDTPAHFRAFLDSIKFPPDIVRLSSMGGDLGAALELGRFFRDLELETEIGETGDLGAFSNRVETGSCQSACAYAFLGGARRLLEANGTLGFHQFLDMNLLQDSTPRQVSGTELVLQSAKEQAITGRIVEYLIEMEIDLRLYQLAATVAPGDMRFITIEEAGIFGVDNFQDTGGPWNVIAFGSGMVAEFVTRVSDRTFRIYCTEAGEHHIAVLKAPDNVSAEGELKRLLQSPEHTLEIKAGRSTFPARLVETGRNEESEQTYYVFRISSDAAQDLATASQWRFQIKGGVMRGFADYIAATFGVSEITGDKRLPRQILRTCI